VSLVVSQEIGRLPLEYETALFRVEQQKKEYRDSVIPPDVKARVSVEQASTFGWERYTGLTGERIGMKTFGASAPLKELQKKFGITVDNVIAAARSQLQSTRTAKQFT